MTEASRQLDFQGLGGTVADHLRDAILAGKYTDGDRIVERELAESLGISRGPVRDALKQLSVEGLVTLIARRGARIATLTQRDAAQTIEVREALEPVAVRFMLSRTDPDLLRPLEAVLQEIREASRVGDWSALVTLDMRFHETIFQLADSPILLRTWETLRVPLLQTFRMHRRFYESGQQVFRSHRLLLDELQSGDLARAESASRAHVVDLRELLLPSLK